ncbi:MAG: coenzyme F430 synthase [Candidatus Methanomethylophilaceae archaeon]|jgi:hypothetical protein
MKILILDTIHGAGILADRYSEGNEVMCVDVYGTTPEEDLEKLRKKGYGVSRSVPPGNYDLVIMPGHCPDSFLEDVTYGRRIFFSEAVKEKIDDGRFRIEVTGVKGKTSSCYLMAHLLSAAGKKVYLHTSRGRGPWIDDKHRINEKASIAPISLLTVPEGDYDAVICEVSLGGSGKADIACITNLLSDYGIAKNTRKASDAKADIFSDGINIVPESEKEFWSKYSGRLTGYGGRITVSEYPKVGGSLKIKVDYGNGFEIGMKSSYLAAEYIEAAELALQVCSEMEIPEKAVKEGLSSFEGVPGRGEISEKGGRYTVTERNPGVSELSFRRTLEILKKMDSLDGALAVVDPVNKKVCCKLDAGAIKEAAEEFGVPLIITEGEGVPSLPKHSGPLLMFVKEGFA